MRWISSEGGPLILLPESALRYWTGCDAPSAGGSDYDRACEVSAFAEVIAVEAAEALVLGEHMQTTWIPAGSAKGMIVQWLYAEDEASVSRALGALPESIFRENGLRLHVSDSVLYLFDSATAGISLNRVDASRLS